MPMSRYGARMSTVPFGVRTDVRDWAVAVGVAATLLVTGLSGEQPTSQLHVLGYVLLAVGGLALSARRRAPVAVLAVTGLCAAGYQAAGRDVPAVAYLFAVYAAVRAAHRTIAVVTSVAMVATLPLDANSAPPARSRIPRRPCCAVPAAAMPAPSEKSDACGCPPGCDCCA